MSSGMKKRLCRNLEKVLHAEHRELPAAAGGILLFFLLFLAYSMLRPVRETMGIAGGVQNLQWLFTATFAASIGGQFLFGWVSSKVRRKAILPWTYGFFILNLAVFAALVLACPGNVWTARSFYVWLSVFNLLTVSVAWSVLSDVMKPGQMKRLFALVASGSSLGAMAGPAVIFWRWRCWRECTCTAGVTGIPRKMRKREFFFRPIAGNALWEGTRLPGRPPYSGLPS